MLVADTIEGLRRELSDPRHHDARIGLVPTMGALHDGHWALIERAVRECDTAVVSIFVNPLQFGPGEDLDNYPRTRTEDLAGCRQRGASVVFAPTVDEMYDGDPVTNIHVRGLSEGLCGAHRPGHFDGVCTVVCKLLNIVQPTVAYFGEKDFQQLTIVRRMVADLSIPVEIIGCPIVRDHDGMALSSRNAYLSADERRRAAGIFAALASGQELVAGGERNADVIIRHVTGRLNTCVDTIEYVAIVDPDGLSPVESLDKPVRLCVACRVGTTRLIDNIALDAGAGAV
ncbi:MAG: pantoate--beta-alanine ligase [Phycisphaerales bacterium]|nr:pantoate--beta-alanine ligase [Phycisphaerales bacterium]